MTWSPLLPVVGKNAAAASLPVSITINPVSDQPRQRQRLLVLVRGGLLDGGLRFWKPGASVAVHIGSGEHDGMLRITPGFGHLLRRAVGVNAPPTTAALAIHGLRNMPAAGTKSAAVEYDYGDDWLELTLPEWACAPKPTVAPVAAPYRGVAASTGLGNGQGRATVPVSALKGVRT